MVKTHWQKRTSELRKVDNYIAQKKAAESAEKKRKKEQATK